PNYFLGGQMTLDPEIAKRVIKEKVADKLSMEARAAAYGIYQIVNANMANGIRVASISRGADPRGCLYIVAGGAGPVHACAIADELEMELILIPRSSSVFCASGMLISNLRHDFVRACYMQIQEGDVNNEVINAQLKEMRDQANVLLEAEMIPVENRTFNTSFDVRYEGQFNEIETPITLSGDGVFSEEDIPVLQKVFDQRHDALYGYHLPGSPVELIAVRVKAEGMTEKPAFREVPFAGEDASGALKGEREIYYEGKSVNAKVYEGVKVANGNRIAGPAIVEEATTTVLVAPNYKLQCDSFNNFLLCHKEDNLEEVLRKLAG
ncbi:MAG: hydantoinase/oxoprolinase family protein, partial [Deltaproteobacteria bacterium]|nr:hydantoinase/oxoprolinase family protein [Deltaproteobacteria bacterium]